MGRAETLAATRASISTPVWAVVVTLVVMATPSSHRRISTLTCESGRAWHMGIKSEVRLAAMIPAMRATSSGSPLGLLGRAFSTAGFMRTKTLASASRLVGALPGTVTIPAPPGGSSGEGFLALANLYLSWGGARWQGPWG